MLANVWRLQIVYLFTHCRMAWEFLAVESEHLPSVGRYLDYAKSADSIFNSYDRLTDLPEQHSSSSDSSNNGDDFQRSSRTAAPAGLDDGGGNGQSFRGRKRKALRLESSQPLWVS